MKTLVRQQAPCASEDSAFSSDFQTKRPNAFPTTPFMLHDPTTHPPCFAQSSQLWQREEIVKPLITARCFSRKDGVRSVSITLSAPPQHIIKQQ
jgi:hypothetical protein